jgi:hypothetical protein
MRDFGQTDTGLSPNLQSLLQFIRAIAAILGVIAIGVGLYYATRVFGLVFGALNDPAVFQATLDKWVIAVGAKELDIAVAGTPTVIHGARPVALATLGGGCFILTWISIGITVAGAKIIYWTLSDREAVRQLLTYAFGPSRRPEAHTTGEG